MIYHKALVSPKTLINLAKIHTTNNSAGMKYFTVVKSKKTTTKNINTSLSIRSS